MWGCVESQCPVALAAPALRCSAGVPLVSGSLFYFNFCSFQFFLNLNLILILFLFFLIYFDLVFFGIMFSVDFLNFFFFFFSFSFHVSGVLFFLKLI